VEASDVVATLAGATGLPLAMLDAAAPLDVESVRAFFEQRVLGQPEAVDCLVERIAMVKAGLSDPTRPLGVFLFAGPTGTGKTEIAKALAEFLFGSAGRMVRLDMTEYQTPESLDRLLSDTAQSPQAAPLIAAVRKDPFSVVLLDEFEKAASPIWDVFLQLFDDGRLTDLQGRTVDFRRCIIVLTSNVGSAIAQTARLGFDRSPEPFRRETVERAVERLFRPEFRNRLDRIVVFRPFEREQMRALVEKELGEVLRRRGLRSRPWAVEFDEAALEFLIERGFSRDLGARPLKRAIEQHLLAPLARAIVDRRVPEGDQFLFVSASRGRALDVTFVDPDANGVEPGTAEAEEPAAESGLTITALVAVPRTDPAAAAFLIDELARVEAAIRGDEIQSRKLRALESVGRPGFWDDASRFVAFAEAEYLDRLDAALRTAEKLAERLRRSASRAGAASSELVELLAIRLHVLDRALAGLASGAPTDVFVRVRPAARARSGEAAAFAGRLAAMYLTWGERRGMHVERLTPENALRGEHVLAVSGLGASTILADESGVHVLEVARPGADGDRMTRLNTVVHVAPWPPGPRLDDAGLLAQARRVLDSSGSTTTIVRRYRPEPSPLVRDSVRGYRTGKLDRVLAGDFDVF
jgi:ATP-dependent Clp protease ATP-binding subunit ClpC